MTDKERREDDALKSLIQTAYDFSDEQLLADLEEVEATLSDSDFPGIEERMYQKLKARLDEEEALEHPEITSEDTPATILPEEEKKVVRFGKKKVLVVGILAAAFVGMLGVTAIGGKNYFFRDGSKSGGFILDTDKTVKSTGELEKVYGEIEEIMEIDVLKLGYVPKELELINYEITQYSANLEFLYGDKVIHLVQEQQLQSASVGINSDRNYSKEIIKNEWIKEDIYLEEEILEDGNAGYGVEIVLNNTRYRLVGQIPKEEFIKIVEKLIF